MCEGPHVDNTRQLPAGGFKLEAWLEPIGAVIRQANTRVYAWAETKDALDQHVRAHKEALARDHKKLGRELGLFHGRRCAGACSGHQGQYHTQRTPGLHFYRAQTSIIHIIHHILVNSTREDKRHYPYYQESQYPPLVAQTSLKISE